jgi:hypothetical protein
LRLENPVGIKGNKDRDDREDEEDNQHGQLEGALLDELSIIISHLIVVALDEISILDKHAYRTKVIHDVKHHHDHVENHHAEIHGICDAHQYHGKEYFSEPDSWQRYGEGHCCPEMSQGEYVEVALLLFALWRSVETLPSGSLHRHKHLVPF